LRKTGVKKQKKKSKQNLKILCIFIDNREAARYVENHLGARSLGLLSWLVVNYLGSHVIFLGSSFLFSK
jgi:hypothetical protein